MVDDFKHTDAGLIPHEWDASPISDLFKFKQGVQCPVEKQFKSDADGLKRFIRIIDLTDSTEPIRYISDPGESHHVKKDDLFMVRYGSPGLLGFGFKGVIANNLFRLLPKKELSTNFYYHYLSYISDKILAISGSSTMPAISFSSLNDLPIVVPPTKTEQTAIATALNDADALITALEKLIAKKKAIKQGAMQELLKPKDVWEERTIGYLADVVGGGTPSSFNTKYWNGKINWFTPTEVGFTKYLSGSLRKITDDGYANCSAKMLPVGTILLTSRAGIGDVGILTIEACTNQGFQSLIPKDNSDGEFLYYLMSKLKNQLLQNASGSTFLEISPGKLKAIEVTVPKKSEQILIAEILSDMDNEIFELEAKLKKQKQIKQGMMQVLLTGKIRLM